MAKRYFLELLPSKSRPGQGTTFNQRSERVQILVANLFVPRRPV